MHRTVQISLALAFAISGAVPAFANENSGDKFLAIDVLDDICGTPRGKKFLDDLDQAAETLPCEPLPVALDLRFMDDDFEGLAYDLPIALDLDWESGEP